MINNYDFFEIFRLCLVCCSNTIVVQNWWKKISHGGRGVTNDVTCTAQGGEFFSSNFEFSSSSLVKLACAEQGLV
jgi:hypothetical protein